MAFSSAAFKNGFGHPSWDVFSLAAQYTDDLSDTHQVRRCAGKKGCESRNTDERIYDTASAKTMVVKSDGSGFDLTCERSGGC